MSLVLERPGAPDVLPCVRPRAAPGPQGQPRALAPGVLIVLRGTGPWTRPEVLVGEMTPGRMCRTSQSANQALDILGAVQMDTQGFQYTGWNSLCVSMSSNVFHE